MKRRWRPPVVLGVCSFTHDSAAALVVDGHMTGMAEEERLSGVKHTRDYPEQAVAWLLAEAGLTAADVKVVAYNFAGHRYLAGVAGSIGYLLRPATRRRAMPRAASFAVVHARYRQRMRVLREKFPGASIRSVAHHRAHGLYALAASGYEEAAVLITDSLGETCTTSIGHGRADGHGVRYRIAETISDPASLGYAYGAVTAHLGWRRGDEEGTVMALAALGDPARFRDLMACAIALTPTGFSLDAGLFPLRVLRHGSARVTTAFIQATCRPRRPDEEISQIHADLAAAVQERTEQVMVHLARRARQRTGSRLLCVGGGVAMNCVAIGKIIDSGLFDEVFVPPAPGDSGTPAGAAIAACLDIVGSMPGGVEHACYLGPAYSGFLPDPVPLPGLAARQVAGPAGFLAARLADGKIAGLFQGRLEAGPRALGNRSILASPLVPDVAKRLNAAVKFREPFRPFAPVVLADKAADYFRLAQPSPYMSIAAPVTELAQRVIPAVVHANGTARVQTLTAGQNPFLAEVLQRFADLTGVPVLINTSLNVKGKPICGTPQMALDCLASSGLDGLMLDGGWWVSK
ncbi:MAG TPA: carbamoyltransferase C-terminal domain-containing protein [Streptosporangiaceae bacterium]|nr:carbamoyltransferase C-terminal domain-containing protein [Streptosporangiaceae bacterium]